MSLDDKNSDLPPTGSMNNHRACLIGFAAKGPVGSPTQIATQQQLYHFYGTATPETPMVLVAEQILAMNAPLLMVRIADEAAETASVNIECNTDQIVLAGKEEPYRFKKNSFFRWSCNGVISTDILVALSGTFTAAELAQQLNEQVSHADQIHFYDHENKLAIRCNGQLAIESVQDSVYQSLGLDNLVTPATLTSVSKDDVELNESHNIQIVISGSGNLTIDNITQSIGFKSLIGRKSSPIEVANCINSQLAKNLPGGFEAAVKDGRLLLRTTHAGSNAHIEIKAASTARKVLGFECLKTSGTSEVIGPTPHERTPCFVVQSDSPGTVGNAVKVQIEPGDGDSFGIKVFHDSSLVESWANLTKDAKDKFYVESFINLVSNWIRVIDNKETNQRPRFGTYQLGKDRLGTNGIVDGELKRRELFLSDQGLNSLLDGTYDIDLISFPGEQSAEVINSLIEFCEGRGDCLAVIDSPKGFAYGETVKWKNLLLSSENAAMFWPWVKVWDTKNRSEAWIPPCGSVIATLVRCDLDTGVWNAASGASRGGVLGVLETMHRPRYDRNGLKIDSDMNCIIGREGVFFVNNEVTLGGAKVSLRRLVFLLKKLIRTGIDTLLRDCKVTDDYFTDNFIRICDHILKQVKYRQGIQHYHIRAGDEINTPEVRAKGSFRAQVGVQPSNTSIWVNFDFSVHEMGAGCSRQRMAQARTGDASR